MGCQMLTTWPKLCRGEPLLDREFMFSHEPEVGQMWHGGNRVMSPDTPYAAACAQNAIYFIDQRYDVESALHIKEQLENLIADKNGHWFIDEIDATAERRDADGKTIFKFNPAYARVFFAESMNSRNPSLNLPVHEPAGDWMVVYDTKNAQVGGKAKRIGTGINPRENATVTLDDFLQKRDDCEDLGCNSNEECHNKDRKCDSCDMGRLDNHCRDGGLVNAVGICVSETCKAAVDTPRFEGESDADYYQRMDKLHWH
ncbi:uncharacterized protein RCC_07247 [Ramularia collo-cygni]|uniref:Uncharacterized protein n=1 Tax=Ramularia collo-cygni TaxID=112498 RepID=A0A2D3VEW2_9PEZI|nr:uncharacterized protein RCC_07247 [Ramularia collo-cygni]CZT21384.1 uncharacterized protein RCC_07247 [Ramularia collo-cygni]